MKWKGLKKKEEATHSWAKPWAKPMCLALTKKLRIAPRVFISGHPLLFLFLFFKIGQQVYFTGTFSDRKTGSKFLDLKN
jgi:hypothetical protein